MPKYSINGQTYDVADENVEEFLRKYPMAQLVEDTAGKPEPTSQGALVEPMQAPVMESSLGATSLAFQSAPVAEAAIASPVPAESYLLENP
jgi:hypothetical protein